ncbi:MAG TPA: dCMP deaminase family protein [Patescibacteria group bacterium]|nr:dCMP deaminase family protein [Patescibacteria group bacterium]
MNSNKKKKSKRKDWDTYFLNLSEVVSSRSTCDRLHVGAVIVNDHRILTTGYNGSLRGASHCDDVGHLMVKRNCKRTTHAEINAIAQAAAYGIPIKDCHIYITHAPCLECFRMIVASGITRIFFSNLYTLTEESLKTYREVVGYRDGLQCCNWELSINSKVWYKT